MAVVETLDPVLNGVTVTVSGTYTTETTVTLSPGEKAKLPDLATRGQFDVVWWDRGNFASASVDPNHEYITVAANPVSDDFSVTRARQGTSVTNKNTIGGEYVWSLVFHKRHIEVIRDAITHTVKQFGATGTGSSNDTQAFKDAVAAIEASITAGRISGASLLVPPGDYGIDDTIDIVKDNIQVWCYQRGDAVLRWIGSTTVPMFQWDPAVAPIARGGCKNLELRGTSSVATSGDGIKCTDPTHFDFDGLEVKNFGGVGILCQIGTGTACEYLEFSRCAVRFNLGGGVRIDGGVSTARRISIDRCKINQNDVYGLFLKDVDSALVSASEFSGYGLGKNTALHLAHPVVISGGNRISLRDLYLNNNAGDATNQTKLIRVGFDAAGAPVADLTTSLVIDGCHFGPNSRTTCVQLGKSRVATISNNWFEFGGAGREGIEMMSTLQQTARIIRMGNAWDPAFPLADRIVGPTPPMGLDYDGRLDGNSDEYFHPEIITENSAPESAGHVYRGFVVRRRGDTHPSAMLTSRRLLMDTGSVDPDVAPGMVGLEFGTGAPEGVLARPRGFLFVDTATGQMWIKKTVPTTSTGWQAVTST